MSHIISYISLISHRHFQNNMKRFVLLKMPWWTLTDSVGWRFWFVRPQLSVTGFKTSHSFSSLTVRTLLALDAGEILWSRRLSRTIRARLTFVKRLPCHCVTEDRVALDRTNLLFSWWAKASKEGFSCFSVFLLFLFSPEYRSCVKVEVAVLGFPS